MAGEMIASVQNGASLMTIVSSAKNSEQSAETGEFAQVLGECGGTVSAAEKDENGIVDVQLSEAAALMAAYMPFAGYDVTNPDDMSETSGVEVTEVSAEGTAEIAQMPNTEQIPFDGEIGTDGQAVVPTVQTVAATAEVGMTDTAAVGAAENGEIDENAQSEFGAQTVQSSGNTQAESEPAVQSGADNVQKLTQIITNSGIQAKEVESVKYVTFNSPLNSVGKEKTINKMENLIQNLFFGVDEPEKDEEETVKNVAADEAVETDNSYVQTGDGVTAENTVSESAPEDGVSDIAQTDEPSFEFGTAAESETESGFAGETDSRSENGGENGAGRDSLAAKVKNGSAEKTHGAFTQIQGQGHIQTHSFKLYNTDTNVSTSQQLGRIMTSALKTDGFIDTAQPAKEMVLQLQPETLGKIIIKLQSVDGELNVKLTATNEQVRQMISSQLAQLSETIKEQGVNLNNIQLEHSALQNNREQSGGEHSGQKEQSGGRKDDEKADYQAVMEDIEAALASIEISA